MSEEIKSVLPEDSVIRLLEQQSKYGLDQESMLVYMSSLNLMSILQLLNRRYGGSTVLTIPTPGTAPVLPSLAPGATANGSPSMENMLTTLMKMLSNSSGGGGQGLNPAMLMNLLSVLGGQNMDLGKIMNMLAGLMGSGPKPGPGPDSGNTPKTGSTVETGGTAAAKEGCTNAGKIAGEEKVVKREAPKIMKWEHLDDRKKA